MSGLDWYTHEEVRFMFAANPLMSAEYEPDFLWFDLLYDAARKAVDKSAVIVDAGCAMGLQGRLFADFRDYIGIELPQPDMIAGCPPNKNAWELFPSFPGRFIEGDAKVVLADLRRDMDLSDIDNYLVIVSAVPDFGVKTAAERLFPNTLTWYPGSPVNASGKWAQACLAVPEVARYRANLDPNPLRLPSIPAGRVAGLRAPSQPAFPG